MSVLYYTQCWEDPDTGREALRLGRDDDLLIVTSAGCNVLALALEAPRTITAVDVNPAQNHLLELKIAAIRGLDHDALLAFLGVRPSATRANAYRGLRGLLSVAARDFWDGESRAIERGVIHAGRLERYLGLFRRVVLPLTQGRARVRSLLAFVDLPAQRSFYEREWDNWRWRSLFRVFFARSSQRRLGRHPAAFRYVGGVNVGDHYLERARHALVDLPVRDNHFVEYALTGTYRDPRRLPPYLLERNFERLRACADRIVIRTASVEATLATAPAGAYSAFYLSDIFEWMPPDRHEAVLHDLVRVSRDGARVLAYENLVSHRSPERVDGAISIEHELQERLRQSDRSFLYRDLVIARVRVPAT